MKINETNILLISGSIFLVLIFLAIILSGIAFAIATNLVFIAMIILFVPYSLYRLFEFKKIRAYEREFPNFLRDIAESQRAGLSILQAIKLSTKSDYGSLSNEIKKMNIQLSWNVALETVLANFRKRMEKSSIILRSMMIIEQANKSGGNVEDTMDSLASNIEMLRDAQEEKAALLNQHVLMMYAIFFIFLGITLALIKFLIPLVEMRTEGELSFIQTTNANPCYECIDNPDPACFGCNTFFAVSAGFGFGEKESASTYYKSLFFVMIIIQGVCTGLIIGQIKSDSVIAGIKHSMIMFVSGVVIFLLILKSGFI